MKTITIEVTGDEYALLEELGAHSNMTPEEMVFRQALTNVRIYAETKARQADGRPPLSQVELAEVVKSIRAPSLRLIKDDGGDGS